MPRFGERQRSRAWVSAVDSFPEAVRPHIDALWGNGGVLNADVVQEVAGVEGQIGNLMMRLLPIAQQYAVVPISDFEVGAVAAGMPAATSGWCSLYLGANFEFRDVALSFTVHAEQAATNNAWLSGEPGIQSLAISAAPCGYCRQFLYELGTAKHLQILLPGDADAINMQPLTAFLPDPFGPTDLGVDGGLMDPKLCRHSLTLESGHTEDPVIAAALKAAEGSYSPYLTSESHGYAGVAVATSDGSVFAGRVAESAAYNPSLSPLESALAFMNMRQSGDGSRMVNRCVLVEVPTLISQLSATKAVLASYAPGVQVEYFPAVAT